MGPTRSVSRGVTVMVLAAQIASGQNKPDFTGTWTQTDPQLSSGSSRSEQIEQQGNLLRVRLEWNGQGLMGYWGRDDRSYTIGGPVESRRDAEGRVRTVAVSWEDSTLVFTRTTTEGTSTTAEREVWSLSNGGRRLVKWRGQGAQRVVFEKQ